MKAWLLADAVWQWRSVEQKQSKLVRVVLLKARGEYALLADWMLSSATGLIDHGDTQSADAVRKANKTLLRELLVRGLSGWVWVRRVDEDKISLASKDDYVFISKPGTRGREYFMAQPLPWDLAPPPALFKDEPASREYHKAPNPNGQLYLNEYRLVELHTPLPPESEREIRLYLSLLRLSE